MRPALQTKKRNLMRIEITIKTNPAVDVVGRTGPKTPASRSLHKSAHPSCQIFEWMFISVGNGELFQVELLKYYTQYDLLRENVIRWNFNCSIQRALNFIGRPDICVYTNIVNKLKKKTFYKAQVNI